MKQCKKFEKQLTAYIHGELSEPDFQSLETHLTSCTSCRAELETMRGTLGILDEVLEEAPAPEQLTARRTIPKRPSVHRPTLVEWWYSTHTRAVLVTAAACSVFFMISLSFVVVRIQQKADVAFEAEVSFDAKEVDRPNMQLKKLKVSVNAKKKNPEPKLRKQIVVKKAQPEFEPVAPAPSSPVLMESLVASSDSLSGLAGRVGFAANGDKWSQGRMLQPQEFNTEQYDQIVENNFKTALDNPLSTFSIDVDRAAYANVRRFLSGNQLPPPDAVRIEEMVNYFEYDYPQPKGEDPFVVSMEVASCPWNNEHQLALIGLQGLEIETKDLPPNNLVFLLDVSGSMSSPDKLPLLKSAMRLLVEQLRPEDRVSIVVYAGAAGLVLEPTNHKAQIVHAINNLNAGGSTAGGAGIELAYKTAKEAFIKNGNNRVILATDGDFNVGACSDDALVRLIEKKRKSDIFLTVLGFGSGNLKDSKMEKLADKGNGNYAYIDDILEAKKVLVNEMGGTLVTIAKDVKVQVEFNPRQVKAYRLIGYENRVMAKEDFDDDQKDAGELGAGHTVTALYELVLAGSDEEVPMVGNLRYQKTNVIDSDELMTVKLRYKNPDGDVSRLITETFLAGDFQSLEAGGNIGFASAVAEFGLLLRGSEFKGNASYDDILQRAKATKGPDSEGYRAEFVRLVEKAQLLAAAE